ncbi:MAG: hypothetical protein V9F82_07475 [Dermatophilaceae bacterium]
MQRINRRTPLDVNDLVFGIGPLINAAGRLGDAREAVRLLLSADQHSALDAAGALVHRNRERREVDYANGRRSRPARLVSNPTWEQTQKYCAVQPRLAQGHHRHRGQPNGGTLSPACGHPYAKQWPGGRVGALRAGFRSVCALCSNVKTCFIPTAVMPMLQACKCP